jgi:protein-S-isoprenylcysteine O-methyltransferase Ste14
MRIPVPWVFVLTYLLGAGLESLCPGVVSPRATPATSIAGAVLFAAGAVIAGWGLAIFRNARTTTVPGESSAKLVTWGPYRVTRNPMYVGLILAYIGEGVMLRQIWPLVFLPLIVAYLNWTVIPVEEARLTATFRDDYEQYRAKVRRWL